jgi:hypothetical protein
MYWSLICYTAANKFNLGAEFIAPNKGLVLVCSSAFVRILKENGGVSH